MNWTDILRTIAPTVASAALGPLGGMAVAAIGEAIGIDAPTQEKIAKAITSGQLTPEALERIKTLEMQYQNDEKERGFKYAELEFQDVDSARKRDSFFAQAGTRNYRADFMFVLAVAMISGLVWLVWKDPSINEYMKGIFTLVLGRFLGYLDNIYNFEFGSTRASKTKDVTIENLSR